jgi:putative inorganic carbon (HCO3(-)) transporter
VNQVALAPAAPDDAGPRRPLLLTVFGVVSAQALVVGHAPTSVDGVSLIISLALLAGLLLTSRRPRASLGTGIALLLTLATVVAATMNAAHPLLAAYAAPTSVLPVVTFFAVRVLDDDETKYPLLGLVAGGLLHAVTALYQRFVQWPDALRRADELQLEPSVRMTLSILRPIGLSVSPDLMSGIVLAGLAASVALASTSRRAWPVAVLLAIPLLSAVVVARSTTSFLATGGALALVLVLVGRARIAVVGILVSAALFSLSGRGVDAARLSLSERVLNWRSALDVIASQPLLGVGPGGYADAYAMWRHPGANVTLYAHSSSLHVAAELGVWAGVALTCIVLVIVGRACVLPRPLPLDRAVLVGAAFALVVRCLVDYDLQVGQSAVVVALVIGMVSRFSHPATTTSTTGRSLTLITIALVMILAVIVTVRLTAHEEVLSPFERGEVPDARDAEALLAYADAHPSDATVRSLAARIVVERALRCGAECVTERAAARARVTALLTAPHPASSDHVLAARLSLADGDTDGVYREAARALVKDSANIMAHEVRMQASVQANDKAQTRSFVDEAKRWLTPGQAQQAIANAGAQL